jgi:hypothetical protein
MNIETLMKEAEDEPKGIIARSADGRLFFIPDAEAKRLATEDSKLHQAFIAASGGTGPVATPDAGGPCQRVKIWLDTHNPNSAKWRALCLSYFNNCA